MQLGELKSIIRQTSSHIYLQPSKMLQPYIAHYTIMSETQTLLLGDLTLIPDISGCVVIQIFHDHLLMNYWGPTTKAVFMENNRDILFQPLYVFIEFKPLGAYAFFSLPQHLVLDEQIPLSNFSHVLYQRLLEAYSQSSTIAFFIAKIDSIFETMLKPSIQPVMFHIQKQITLHQGTLPLEQIIDRVGYSKRHIQRLFLEQTGTNMKTYARIERINKAIMMMNTQMNKLTYIAQQCGYYDQSHFIHDFKEICGVTPSEYMLHMSSFYNESLKF